MKKKFRFMFWNHECLYWFVEEREQGEYPSVGTFSDQTSEFQAFWECLSQSDDCPPLFHRHPPVAAKVEVVRNADPLGTIAREWEGVEANEETK